MHILSNEWNLLTQLILLLSLIDIWERLKQDSNYHIEHNDRQQESAQEEHPEDQELGHLHLVGAMEVIDVEFLEGPEQVNREHRVHDLDAGDLGH